MSELAETRSSLYCQYALIAGQHLLTLITRIALPYFEALSYLELEQVMADLAEVDRNLRPYGEQPQRKRWWQ
eukprot:COSAG06_NODE_17958_length_912_cov_0.902829_2_plen_72_part_00